MTVTNRSPPARRCTCSSTPITRTPSQRIGSRSSSSSPAARRLYWQCASTHQDVWRCWPWRRGRRSARPGPTALVQVVQPSRTRQINTGEGKARISRGTSLVGCVVTPIIGRPRPHAQLPHPARAAPQPHRKKASSTCGPYFSGPKGGRSPDRCARDDKPRVYNESMDAFGRLVDALVDIVSASPAKDAAMSLTSPILWLLIGGRRSTCASGR